MKVLELLFESNSPNRGTSLLDYLSFAEEYYLTKKTRDAFDKLAHDLINRGYSFSVNRGTASKPQDAPRSGVFSKKDDGEIIRVTIIGKPANSGTLSRSLNSVMVVITGENPGTGKGRIKGQTYDIADMTDNGADLDYILSGLDF